MIKIVRIAEFLIIGETDADTQPSVMAPRGKVTNPRVIQMNQQGQLMLAELVGSPKEFDIALDKVVFSYELADERLIADYRQAVTGLVLARGANVVDIGRA
jgi:hypothetical protein